MTKKMSLSLMLHIYKIKEKWHLEEKILDIVKHGNNFM